MTTIFTVGHSTHPIDEFVAILSAHGIRTLVDVRSIPKSRHNPQFGEDQLPGSLEKAGIRYQRLGELGGLRHSRKESPNKGWRNTSFRGYADYMQTDEFADGIQNLIDLAQAQDPAAIMCAEAVPWRCHRSLIGDALLVRGHTVLDIMSEKDARPHKLTSFAHVDGLTVTYPPNEDEATAD
ncbi:MAG TPA: DUF488 domain-containing protein [Terrimesophilobacter sp.]|nr:DUF488 domain-containing protein [Terrimesophilobacter sp.]